MKAAIIIPAFNEGHRLRSFLARLVAFLSGSNVPDVDGFRIIVVDDGSVVPINLDPLGASAAAHDIRLYLVRHAINLGQGAALQTGISYALESPDCGLFITMDADGQHQPEDIPGLVETLKREQVGIVFGNRFAAGGGERMPLARRLILKAAILFELIVTRIKLSDAHNGFRCFNRDCAECISLKQNRMAHATEFRQIVGRHGLRYAEAPVSIYYSQESLRKGQRNIGSLTILKDLTKAYLFDG